MICSDDITLMYIWEDFVVWYSRIVHLHDTIDPIQALCECYDQVVVLSMNDFPIVSYLPAPSYFRSGCSQMGTRRVH